MGMKHSLELSLHFKNEKEAKIVYRAIIPDIIKKYKRSSTEIKCKGKEILFRAVASDLNALKASFNSFIKQVTLSERIIENFS